MVMLYLINIVYLNIIMMKHITSCSSLSFKLIWVNIYKWKSMIIQLWY